MDEGAITCDGLTRRFASGTALDGLTLSAAPGQVLALLGPNGAGKTTTVRLLNGVLRPDAGKASVLGLDPWADGDAVRRRTGVLTEQAGLDERFTALENLELAAGLRGLDRSDGRRRGGDLLERLGMGSRADTLVRGFSTGERKRVGLARALLHDPEVLFLDEPTSGLDPSATREVVALIAGLAAEHGRTVVLCTHFLGEAGQLADRMAVLIRGRLRALGAPAEIAAGIWTTRTVTVELGGPPSDALLAAARALGGVVGATSAPPGLALEVNGRDDVPAVVAGLVGAGAELHGVRVQEPTLEDVYFAVEARAGAEADPVADHPR